MTSFLPRRTRMLARSVAAALAAAVASGCGSSAGVDAGSGGSTGTSGTSLDSGFPGDSGTAEPDAGPRAAGNPCDADAQCASGRCGAGGAGHCCAAACAGGAAGCGVLDCDGLGMCVYPPAGEPCGTPSCAGGSLTSSACDGRGACAPGAADPCAGHFGCASGSSCAASCTPAAAGPADAGGSCAPGFRCDPTGLRCVPKQVAGGCESDEACASGICLNHSCCAAACAGDGGDCAAASCNLSDGSCVYPSSEVACGGSRSCAGAELTSAYCDGKGGCGSKAETQICPGRLACSGAGAGACNLTCSADADCAAGNLCTPAPSSPQCCPKLVPGGGLWIDAHNGADQGCCGSAAQPCATLTFAMQLVADSHALGTVLHAVNVLLDNPLSRGQSYGVWRPALGETYPVHLGWGVTLEAPSISFYPPANIDVFDLYPYPAEPAGSAVAILAPPDAGGWDSSGNVQETPTVTLGAIDDQSGRVPPPPSPGTIAINDGVAGQPALPLQLSGVTVTGSRVGLKVGGGAAVTLGPAAVNFSGGGTGILCAASSAAPATLRDVGPYGGPTVVGFGAARGDQSAVELDIGSGCSVTFTQAPQIGAYAFGSSESCDFSDLVAPQEGVRASGTAQVVLGSDAGGGTINCPEQNSVHLLDGDAGAPQVTLIGVRVQGSGCAGALVEAGSFRAIGSQFVNHGVGVYQVGGQVDLSAAPGDPPNSFSYSFWNQTLNSLSPIFCPNFALLNPVNSRYVEIGVINVTNTTARLSGVDFGDEACTAPPSPTELICADKTFNDCACHGTSSSCGNQQRFSLQNQTMLLTGGSGIDLVATNANAAVAFDVTNSGGTCW